MPTDQQPVAEPLTKDGVPHVELGAAVHEFRYKHKRDPHGDFTTGFDVGWLRQAKQLAELQRQVERLKSKAHD